MNTYTVRQSQTIYKYATVEASSKAEALKQAEAGDAEFVRGSSQENFTFKVTGSILNTDMWASDRAKRS